MKRALVLVTALVVAIVAMRVLPIADLLGAVVEWLRGLGVLGGVLYVFFYAAAASVFVPGSLLTMLAGATWGLVGGTLVIVPGTVLAATASAALGRTMLREFTAGLLERFPLLMALDRVFGQRAFRFVTLLRLSPVMPFAASNYALGATSAPLSAIAAGTAVGLVPITMVWVYLGTLAGQAVLVGEIPDSPLRTALLFLGLPATIVIVVWLGRLAAAELKTSDASPHDGGQGAD